MQTNDPIKIIDKVVRGAENAAGKYTRPVLKRYPLLFALLLTFGFSAIITGFHLWAEEVPLFHEHPTYLMLIGLITLFLTGTLYKLLKKGHE